LLIILLLIAQNVSGVNTPIFRSLRLFVELVHLFYCSVRLEIIVLTYYLVAIDLSWCVWLFVEACF